MSGDDPLKKGIATHYSILAWKIPQAGGYSPGIAMSQTQLRD